MARQARTWVTEIKPIGIAAKTLCLGLSKTFAAAVEAFFTFISYGILEFPLRTGSNARIVS